MLSPIIREGVMQGRMRQLLCCNRLQNVKREEERWGVPVQEVGRTCRVGLWLQYVSGKGWRRLGTNKAAAA